ncbi:MAG: hypothetical protein WBC51_01230 [Vicinamibacterales bacterium]
MRAWLLTAALLACSCGGPASPSPEAPLKGGVLATFSVGSESFRVWIRNDRAIEQVFALQRGASTAGIPNGRLRAGPGQGGHNAPYTWHLDPEDVEMAGATIEICDGAPSYVEAHRDEFMTRVTRYCPWGAKLTAVNDYR